MKTHNWGRIEILWAVQDKGQAMESWKWNIGVTFAWNGEELDRGYTLLVNQAFREWQCRWPMMASLSFINWFQYLQFWSEIWIEKCNYSVLLAFVSLLADSLWDPNWDWRIWRMATWNTRFSRGELETFCKGWCSLSIDHGLWQFSWFVMLLHLDHFIIEYIMIWYSTLLRVITLNVIFRPAGSIMCVKYVYCRRTSYNTYIDNLCILMLHWVLCPKISNAHRSSSPITDFKLQLVPPSTSPSKNNDLANESVKDTIRPQPIDSEGSSSKWPKFCRCITSVLRMYIYIYTYRDTMIYILHAMSALMCQEFWSLCLSQMLAAYLLRHPSDPGSEWTEGDFRTGADGSCHMICLVGKWDSSGTQSGQPVGMFKTLQMMARISQIGAACCTSTAIARKVT